MAFGPIAIKRKRILGDLNDRCDALTENVPVYLEDENGEAAGFVDESLGRYANAFVFHLPEDICKRLSTDSYECGLNYDAVKSADKKEKRIRLNSIVLKARAERRPLPKRMKASATAEADETVKTSK